MVLKTVDKRGVETYQNLGNRFSLVSNQRANVHFKLLLENLFGEDPMREDVYAIITTYIPGTDSIPIHQDDYNIIYTNDGEWFSKLEPPKKKKSEPDSNG